jgi:hypothetical protein
MSHPIQSSPAARADVDNVGLFYNAHRFVEALDSEGQHYTVPDHTGLLNVAWSTSFYLI